jgi:single-strand DNA-binding protein
MASMAVVCLTGNLGDDAKLNETAQGDKVLSFSLAVKTGYNKSETTTWWRCSLWGKRAETLHQMLTKGKLIGVTGEPSLREYSGESGKKQSLDVRVNDVILLGKRDAAPADDSDPDAVPY